LPSNIKTDKDKERKQSPKLQLESNLSAIYEDEDEFDL
jgi:hypothetical protein